MGSSGSRAIPAGEVPSTFAAPAPSRVGGATHQGHRYDQEDRYALRSFAGGDALGPLRVSELVAVIDGHGGDATAQFTSEHVLAAAERGLATADSFETAACALRQAFVDTERALYAASGPPLSGACVLVAAVTPDMLILASAGDCRSVLVESGGYRTVSVEHKPTAPQETDRIRAAGFTVYGGRVSGDLAVSRSIGDGEFKQQAARRAPYAGSSDTTRSDGDASSPAASAVSTEAAGAGAGSGAPEAVPCDHSSGVVPSPAMTATALLTPEPAGPGITVSKPVGLAVASPPAASGVAAPPPLSPTSDSSYAVAAARSARSVSYTSAVGTAACILADPSACALPECAHAVTCVPDVTCVPRSAACRALLLMTDGAYSEHSPAIFDAVVAAYAERVVGMTSASSAEDSASIAAAMCQGAIASGSSDNVTVVVVPLLV